MPTAYDVVVVGAGAAGSIGAIELVRAGLSVLMIDKEVHPRHRLGESFMPKALGILKEMGLEEPFRALPHVHKTSGQFLFGHEGDEATFTARFERAWPLGERTAFNVERAPFDAMLCAQAVKAGAEVRLATKVTGIVRLADGDVALSTSDGPVTARWLMDCSGSATLVGRHLKRRRELQDKSRVAYYAIAEGVARPPEPDEGAVVGVMHDDAWFWIIPLDRTRSSVGVVMDRAVAAQQGLHPTQVLRSAIERSPAVARRCRAATMPLTNRCVANFSYTCDHWAGPGYFLVGDAGAFVDPIFSTGVTLGMEGARDAARHILALRSERRTPAGARAASEARMKGVTDIFFQLVDAYYDHGFRELLVSGKNPLNVRRALLTLLAGHAFQAPLYLRWRLRLLMVFVETQRRLPLVPRKSRHRLFDTPRAADRATMALGAPRLT